MLFLSMYTFIILTTSKEPVCPRVELIFKIIIILLIIFLGFVKSKQPIKVLKKMDNLHEV